MKTFWFVFCQDALLLSKDSTGVYAVPCLEQCPLHLEVWNKPYNLPSMEGLECKAVAVDIPFIADGYENMPLRASFDVLPFAHYAMAGKARELLYWDKNNHYCGVCGGLMKRDTDISKRCENCGKEVWPSPSTAIIVLVSRGDDEVLLVQSNKFRHDYYGLVAGFLETGETLEQCVEREVFEETQIHVRNIRYVSSQAWPFPFGIMAAFRAEYDGGDVRLQRSELTKGGWFRRDNLPALPPNDSIARKMIEQWVCEK